MRILSWLGAAVILVALGAGGLSAAAAFTSNRHNLVPAGVAMAAAPSAGADAGPRHHAPHRRPAASRTAARPHVAAPARPAQPAARPRIVIGSTQQALINQDRARYGLGALTWSSCLYSIAVSNAKRMAAQGYISHTNGAQRDLGCGLGRQGGENVGWWSLGINDSQLNSMFMNSPDHRANILGPYHYVATAWAVGANGAAYIAVEFA
jgi:uncharacterized protein YkwD